MKIELHRKKIDEADDIQNGNGEGNASQEVKVSDKQQDTNVDTSEINSKITALSGRKTQLKTQYSSDLKVLNDQITMLQKQKSELSETEPQTDEQAAVQKAKMININKQIIGLTNKKLARKTTYQNDVRGIEQNLVALYDQQADNGGDVDPKCVDESVKANYRFSRKLYEAVINRTEEMYAIISMSFDDMGDKLSKRPATSKCKSFAEEIIYFLNNKFDQSVEDPETVFVDFVYGMLNRSHESLSTLEKDRFVKNLVEAMKKNGMFSWVFGIENNKNQ